MKQFRQLGDKELLKLNGQGVGDLVKGVVYVLGSRKYIPSGRSKLLDSAVAREMDVDYRSDFARLAATL